MADFDNPLETEAQRVARERADEAARIKRRLEISDFRWLMGHKQGRRIAWRLLENYGVFRTSFDPDPLVMAYNEGRRNEGLRLMADIHEHTPDKYADMMKERDARSRNSTNDSDNPGTDDDDTAPGG